jgi:hypothetical protein
MVVVLYQYDCVAKTFVVFYCKLLSIIYLSFHFKTRLP